MKTFASDLIPRLSRYSKKLDDLTKFTNKPWIVLDVINNTKKTYIFRANDELIISENGNAEIAEWRNLGFNKVLIKAENTAHLFNHGFLDDDILALKVDGKNEYLLMISEAKYFTNNFNTVSKAIDFLQAKYLQPSLPPEKRPPLPPPPPIRLNKKQIDSLLYEEKWRQRVAIYIILIALVIIFIIGLIAKIST